MDITLFSSATNPREAHHHHHHQLFIHNTNANKHHQMINNINNNDMIMTIEDNNNNNTMQVVMVNNPSATATTTTSGVSTPDEARGGEKWAPRLLSECARAISEKDSAKIHHLLWMLNELASPYGDADQKLASCFLQALFARATASGPRSHRALAAAARKARSFDTARRLILKFQESSPWTTFGHVASNGALLEALDGEPSLHVVDASHTLCTQWPTLLEALATRRDDTPRLRLTVLCGGGGGDDVIAEIGQRMEKFARLMGVPFEFSAPAPGPALTREGLGVREGEAVAVNCVGALRRARRGPDELLAAFRALEPKVVTVVEEEADFAGRPGGFAARFEECLRFYGLYFDMLEESFSATSNEKLMLERECVRGVVRVLACDDDDDDDNDDNGDNDEESDRSSAGEWDCERRERGKQWSERMMKKAFSPVGYSDDVIDDVKALLKRYPSGWGLVSHQQQQQQLCDNSAGIYLTWKDQPVVWASAWKP